MTLSLKTRLVLGVVSLLVLALLTIDLVMYASVKTFLYDRIDNELRDGDRAALSALNASIAVRRGGPSHFDNSHPPSLPQGTYAAVIDPNGNTVTELVFTFPGQTPTAARPVIPSSLPEPGAAAPVIATVEGRRGVDHYRLLIEPLAVPPGDYLALGIPLTDVEPVVQQLVQLELLSGALVVLATAVLSLLIVRIGLLPLTHMAGTAAAIAQGDLSRRVEPASPKTEIGRLGLALNAMLTKIEAAFVERNESNQRLRRFVADASHELRTPLTSIRGYAEMLRRGAEKRPADSALARRRIEEEAVRMTALVDDLLLLARLDQGRPLASERVDLKAIVDDAQADALVLAPTRSIHLDAPSKVFVTGDETRIRQVIGNLVRNALVHTPTGTAVEIDLDTRNGAAVISVVDHGPGLPPGAQDHIFEPFFRADDGRSRDKGGSGLGLSIVAAVVAAHSGTVRSESTPGGGATFVIELPIEPSDREGQAAMANSPAPAS
jgi:two-component system OmpR family sensor kinase